MVQYGFWPGYVKQLCFSSVFKNHNVSILEAENVWNQTKILFPALLNLHLIWKDIVVENPLLMITMCEVIRSVVLLQVLSLSF